MQGKEICRVLGRCFSYFSYILLLPIAVAIYYERILPSREHPQPHSLSSFVCTFFFCLLLACLFLCMGKKASGHFRRKESILIVVLLWLLAAGMGALPFTLSKTLTNPLDAYFESMSALTTTGSTVFYPQKYSAETGEEIPIVLQSPYDAQKSYTFMGTIKPVLDPAANVYLIGLDAVSKAMLFWRNLLQWIGGMGIIVLFISVLPALSLGGKFLFEAEVPGPTKESLTPRIKETAGFLWKIYVGLTAAACILLVITNDSMPLFDAVNLSLSTVSTGGFCIKNEGLAYYNSFSTDLIVMIFMVLGSINFTLYFYIMRGKIYRLYEPELKSYLATLLCFATLISLLLWKIGHFNLSESLRLGFFQTLSAQSSTGFSISNKESFPFSCQLLLVFLMYLGGMSGSTSGGIKIARFTILFKVLFQKMETLFRPDSIRCLKMGEREISIKTAQTTLIYFSLVMLFVACGSFLHVLDGIDLDTSFGLMTCMINNAGISFGNPGPIEACAFLSPFSKALSLFWMLLGRLEIFILLVFFVPDFWRNR